MNKPSNALVPFDFEGKMVRIVEKDGETWFIATDVARILGYRDAANMCRNLDSDEKGTHIVSTLGGDQEVSVVSESGVFHGILKSRREEAVRFRRFVTGELLPTLRREGVYTLGRASGSTTAQIEQRDRTRRRHQLPLNLDRLESEWHPEKRRILYELAKRDCEAEGIAPPEPEAIRPVDRSREIGMALFERIEAMISEGALPEHHRREDRIAFTTRELRTAGLHLTGDQRHALKQHPRFIATCKVNCRDGQSRHCWVFIVVTP